MIFHSFFYVYQRVGPLAFLTKSRRCELLGHRSGLFLFGAGSGESRVFLRSGLPSLEYCNHVENHGDITLYNILHYINIYCIWYYNIYIYMYACIYVCIYACSHPGVDRIWKGQSNSSLWIGIHLWICHSYSSSIYQDYYLMR